MNEICDDKQSPYKLRIEDQPMVDAAISLGVMLKSLPECGEQQAEAIRLMPSFLKHLPQQAPAFNGELGFRI
jgi:hypothetical protein